MAVYAETVLRNGTVWCGRQEGTAEAVALWGGHVHVLPGVGPGCALRGR